jgi:hypothetical protein
VYRLHSPVHHKLQHNTQEAALPADCSLEGHLSAGKQHFTVDPSSHPFLRTATEPNFRYKYLRCRDNIKAGKLRIKSRKGAKKKGTRKTTSSKK